MDQATWHERTRSGSDSLIDALHSSNLVNMKNIGPSSAPASSSTSVSNNAHSSSPSTGQLHYSLRDAVRRAAINDSSSSTDSSSQPEIIFDNATTYGHAHANEDPTTADDDADAANSQPRQTQTNFVSKEQERKELILYLLAQVCALHDSTPKTFIVHVLSLYESGILDDGSIRLLTQQGLVPSANELLAENHITNAADPTHEHAQSQTHEQTPTHGQQQELMTREGCIVRGVEDKVALGYHLEKNTEDDQEQERLDANIDVGAIVPYKSASMQIINGPEMERAHKVFAIRKHLENHEAMANYKSRTASWSVEQHPLSFSRYNREFVQKKMLASGSFGQVFHAVNIMDGCDYAVKKILFSAKGYDTKQVETVIREVQILAKMGDDNVVRYYTSWLEPVWGENGDSDSNFYGDGSDSDESSIDQNTMPSTKLLLGPTDWAETGFDFTQECAENELMNDGENCDSRAGLSAWSFERSNNDGTQDDWDELISHHTKASKSNGISTGEYGSEDSEWTIEQRSRVQRRRNTTTSKYSSSKMHQSSTNGKSSQQKHQPKKNETSVYKYQICLYIQMQLCRPSTLADWIRNRNSVKYPKSPPAQKQRYLDAAAIFKQISCGLAHIHSRGIVHRDLKPANIFQSVEDESFKIGDFGLSKMLQTANGGMPFDSDPGTMLVPINRNASSGAWDDPLTAGVGTSSYAAPEQLSSQNYGSEADIFRYDISIAFLVCH
jgi:serine/threonine protein kinase